MNEETKTPEPLADVLAEMRASSLSTVRAWADRIEAAAEREKQPGNAAALREALEKLTDAVRNYFGWDDAPAVQDRDDPTAYFCAEMSAALAALAAPARNCDLYATAEDAYAAWQKLPNLVSAFAWLFAQAEGGDHV